VQVEILSNNINLEDIVCECKTMYPNLKFSENGNSDNKRLIKKLIKERNILLGLYTVQIKVTCPFFIYYKIKELIPRCWSTNLNIIPLDDLTFESSEDFGAADEIALMALFKRIKATIKDMNPDKAKYFLPLSHHIKVLIFLNILEVYEFLINLSKIKTDKKIKELQNLLTAALYENNNLVFNDQLFEVFGVDKE